MNGAWGNVGGNNGAALLQAGPNLVAMAAQVAEEQRRKAMYRAQAVRTTMDMLDIAERAVDHTLCCMFYVGADKKLHHTMESSGQPSSRQESGVKDLRASIGTARDAKPTFCAEEFLLLAHPEKKFLFSWAFNAGYVNGGGSGQMIRACGAACRALLQRKGIEDLVLTQVWGDPARMPSAASNAAQA
jgi:hypothetical protein